jgi:phosphate transport system permease protein
MSNIDTRHVREDRLLRIVCATATALPLVVLAVLLVSVFLEGLPRISWEFLTSYPSRHAERAGILPGIVGSTLLVLTAAAFALPVGVAAALYLEEYSTHGRISKLIEINIANLAGVPSVVYGLLGLQIFVHTFGMPRSVLVGGLTLGLLVLPVVVITAREAVRTVPDSLREAALGLGSTRWQMVRQVVLPTALPGILTGAILAVSRAIGETAPIVVVGALAFMTFVPDGPASPFSALPVQIFNWSSRPQHEFAVTAAAGIIVLLVLVLALNAGAIILRDRLQNRMR